MRLSWTKNTTRYEPTRRLLKFFRVFLSGLEKCSGWVDNFWKIFSSIRFLSVWFIFSRSLSTSWANSIRYVFSIFLQRIRLWDFVQTAQHALLPFGSSIDLLRFLGLVGYIRVPWWRLVQHRLLKKIEFFP